MADLLECLVQIRALAETVGRLTRLAAAFPGEAWSRHGTAWPDGSALDVLARMTEEEIAVGVRLWDSLTPLSPRRSRPTAPERSLACSPDTAHTLDRFAAQRRNTLELLGACSANDLALKVPDPERAEFQVADLVAEMLARDTDHLGEIFQRLSSTVAFKSTDGEY